MPRYSHLGMMILSFLVPVFAVRAETSAERARTALASAKAHNTEAIPILINLLAELNIEQRTPIEEFLTELAGEWAPQFSSSTDDKVSRKIRRDAWAAWWRNSNGEALLEALHTHTPTAQTRRRIAVLIRQLGSEAFGEREAASRQLFSLGRVTLPQLRDAVKDRDAEIVRRAKILVEGIQREPAHRLPSAAIRMLAVRKPASAAAALLAYLPYIEDETQAEEADKVLTLLAWRGDEPDADVLHGLSDARPIVRAAAAMALVKGGGAKGRAKARKMLRDESATVRLRVALALVRTREKSAVPVLIDLLAELPATELGQAEDALYQLAGETAPEVSLGETMAERGKYRDVWATWWKDNAARVDLGRLSERPWYGYTLICDIGRNRVYEIDRHGKERWSINGLAGPADARMVRGNRVLIAEWNAQRVSERDLKNGKILWQARVANPVNVQRLPNGHTIAGGNGASIVEVDRKGKQVYSINNVPGNLLAAGRARDGTIICMNWQGQCLFYDTTGKQLKMFATGHDPNSIGGLDLTPNGRILISRQAQGKVAEYDRKGKLLLELNAPGVRTATALPNGHILVASQNAARVYEMDRKGKIVWEHKNPGNVFRARRR